MSDSIFMQCKKLYMDAFQDDEQFTDLLFDIFYNSSCRYLCENGNVVSMLFAMDITLDSLKGKYVYAVATDERYRGKGYMRLLFDNICEEFKEDYDFLCLKPMDKPLFEFYEKLDFVRCFKKSTVYLYNACTSNQLIALRNVNDISAVRKSLLKENFVQYCDDFVRLLLSYCDMLTDNIDEPRVFAVKEKQSGKVKEILGDRHLLPDSFINIPLLIPGDETDFAMVRFLKDKVFDNKYLGFALD